MYPAVLPNTSSDACYLVVFWSGSIGDYHRCPPPVMLQLQCISHYRKTSQAPPSQTLSLCQKSINRSRLSPTADSDLGNHGGIILLGRRFRPILERQESLLVSAPADLAVSRHRQRGLSWERRVQLFDTGRIKAAIMSGR